MLSSIRTVAALRLASAKPVTQCLLRLAKAPANRKTSSLLAVRNTQPINAYRAFSSTSFRRQEAVAAVEQDSEAGPITRFDGLEQLGIHNKIVSNITEGLGYVDMTEVQAKTIPVSVSGVDVIARAKTGTGKTFAFLIPTVNSLIKEGRDTSPFKEINGRRTIANPQILIISPTRELAEQIAKDAIRLTAGTKLKVATMVGGTGKGHSLLSYHRNGCHILVGTPGRLADVTTDPTSGVDLSKLQTLIYDEADSLMQMGFEKEIREILQKVPKERQTLMFSATMPDKVRQLMSESMRPGYKFINTIDPNDAEVHTKVPQHLIQCNEYENVLPTLFELLYRENNAAIEKGEKFKALVFFGTARSAELAAMMFRRVRLPNVDHHPLMPLDLIQIHSRLTQQRRTDAAHAFRISESGVLFSSDVTARGMDFPNVTHVIQVGTPSNREQYIHRLGRTARGKNIEAGKSAGYIILSPIDYRHAVAELKGIRFLTDTNEDLASPTANLEDLSTLNESAANFSRAVVQSCGRLDHALKNSCYMSMFGAMQQLDVHINELLRGLSRMWKFNFGEVTAPAMTATFAQKMGINHRSAVEKGYLTTSSPVDDRRRDGNTRFSARTNSMDENPMEGRSLGGTGYGSRYGQPGMRGGSGHRMPRRDEFGDRSYARSDARPPRDFGDRTPRGDRVQYGNGNRIQRDAPYSRGNQSRPWQGRGNVSAKRREFGDRERAPRPDY